MIDPLEVGLAEKGDLLVRATATMREHGADIAEGLYQVWDTAKWLVSSDGHRIDQRIRECGAGIMATAIGDGETQRRSYPAARGQYGTRGWELVRELDLEANAARVGEEARALLSAPPCPSGETTLILGDEQMALQIHESVGHAIELDRILGWEAAYAGTSWLDLGQLGSLQYGSELMNITIDPTIAGGLGSFGFDDEGTPAVARDAVREGRWVGVLAGRDSAAVGRPRLRRQRAGRRLGPAADGADDERRPRARTAHAGGDHRQPPTTASSWTPTARGRSTTSGSTSSSAARSATRSRTGGSGGMLRNPTYTGIGPQFWRSMDMLSSEIVRVGHAELRQGPTGPDRPHRPPGRAGPLPQRPRRGAGVSVSIGERRAYGGGELDR